jgi:hypothetical protein
VLILAAILLVTSGDETASSNSSTPPGNEDQLVVWNETSGVWQSTDLMDRQESTPAVFLLNLSGQAMGPHTIRVSFRCGSDGTITFAPLPSLAPDDTYPSSVSPGPGRRPDSTSDQGLVAAWGLTFTDPPAWEDNQEVCSTERALSMMVVGRSSPMALMWSTGFEPQSSEQSASLSTGVSIDGGEESIIQVAFPR